MTPRFDDRKFYGRADFGGISMDVEVFYHCMLARSASTEDLAPLESPEATFLLMQPMQRMVDIANFGTLVRAIGDHPPKEEYHPIGIQGAVYDADLVVGCLRRVRAGGPCHVGTCAIDGRTDRKSKDVVPCRLLQIRGLGWRVYVVPLRPGSDVALRAREAL